ncbi:MAG: hypothetical protein ACRDL7_01945 [Gaiellaceae bacterium]
MVPIPTTPYFRCILSLCEKIWESDGPGTLRFHASDLAAHHDKSIATQKALGALVEDEPLVSALWDALESDNGFAGSIDLFAPARVTNICPSATFTTASPLLDTKDQSSNDSRVVISFHDEGSQGTPPQQQTIKPRLLVEQLMVPTHSLEKQMGTMPLCTMGYGRKAVTTTVCIKPGQSMNKTAYQRFFPSGPLALLPMWDGTWANGVEYNTE